VIDYTPTLEAPLIAPLKDDGPLAYEILDTQLLLTPRKERPRPLISRAALVEARYQDWYNSRAA
jgi:hypothetical protein